MLVSLIRFRGKEGEREGGGGEERVITSLEAESLICATLS